MPESGWAYGLTLLTQCVSNDGAGLLSPGHKGRGSFPVAVRWLACSFLRLRGEPPGKRRFQRHASLQMGQQPHLRLHDCAAGNPDRGP